MIKVIIDAMVTIVIGDIPEWQLRRAASEENRLLQKLRREKDIAFLRDEVAKALDGNKYADYEKEGWMALKARCDQVVKALLKIL